MTEKTEIGERPTLTLDPSIPWWIRGPNGQRIADCSSSLVAGALINTYNAHAALIEQRDWLQLELVDANEHRQILRTLADDVQTSQSRLFSEVWKLRAALEAALQQLDDDDRYAGLRADITAALKSVKP